MGAGHVPRRARPRRTTRSSIFFAGHGAPEVDPRGVERDGLAKYLIPSDADPDDLYSTALPMDELQTIFERIEAERVVAFLDACYSGAAGGRTFAVARRRGPATWTICSSSGSRAPRGGRSSPPRGRPRCRSSCRSSATASSPTTWSRGSRAPADLNRDGIVSLQELYEYVEQQVVQKSRAVGGNQHPVMKGELEGVLPLVRVPPRRP